MRKRKNKNITAVLIVLLILVLFVGGGSLFLDWKVGINELYVRFYPVRGVDVSSYQGEIDWPTLAGQGISFAFIKSTEGSSLSDSRFEYNWQAAQQAGLRVGAYHFFSFDSSGETQAENFIRTVPITEGMLPPVVDLEYYGEHVLDPPTIEHTRAILDELLALLELHYGMLPLIYINGDNYRRYLAGSYYENDIWIRNTHLPPRLSDGRDWTFWQYSSSGHLEGYDGDEYHIDLNVFNGSHDQFSRYPSS